MNSEVMADLNITLLPTLLIVDANDEIVYIHQGYRPGDEKVIEMEIQKHLGEQTGE